MTSTTDSSGAASGLDGVLAAWGRDGARATPFEGATDRWRVERGDDPPMLLRRYDGNRSPEAIAYEHDLLAYLEEQSWPVPVPVATTSGDTALELDGARWALFPLLPGEPPPDESIFLQRRGALLALVHADLAAWDRAVRREAFGRIDDFDAAVRPHGLASFEALLARVQAVDPTRANMLAVLRMRVEEQLEAYGYAELPPHPLWGACNAQHVLFDGDDVTGLIDFDEARGVGTSVAVPHPPGVTLEYTSPEMYRARVGDFCEPVLLATEAHDIACAGLVLWKLLDATHRPAFETEEEAIAALGGTGDVVDVERIDTGVYIFYARVAAGLR